MFAIKFSTIKNQNINKQHKNLTKNILQEKIKTNPDKNKIEKWQRSIENLENYKTKGTVIRSKGRFIVIEEKPTKYFYQQEKQKQAKKQIKKFQNEQNKLPTTNPDILKECQNFY